jgi:ABC-type branched-subunit amino acid transport system substrate-binding protein
MRLLYSIIDRADLSKFVTNSDFFIKTAEFLFSSVKGSSMKLLTLRIIALAAACGTVQFGIGSNAVQASSVPVHVAAVLSLSGLYGRVGTTQSQALATAERVVNEQGGINGRPLHIDVYDDRSRVNAAMHLADGIVKKGEASAIVGGTFAATCAAIRTQTQTSGMVQYCLSGAPRNGKTYFSSFPKASQLFGDQPATFFHTLHKERVAIIVGADGTGAIYAHEMRGALARFESKPVLNAVVSTRASAQRVVDRALKAHADAVYLGTNDRDSIAVLHAMQTRMADMPVWLTNAASRADARTALTQYLPSAPVYTGGDAVDVADELPFGSEQRRALMAYVGTFQHDHGFRPDRYATVTADAMEFLVAALRADGGVGGPILARTLEATPPTTALYSSYHFSGRSHDGTDLPGVIVRFERDGTRKYVGTFDRNARLRYDHSS